MEKYQEMRELLLTLESDFQKFYDEGNKAAGTRIRKGMQNLKNIAQEVRVEVQEKKNELS